MNQRPFLDKNNKPDDESLKAVLGSCYTFYNNIQNLSSEYKQQWNHSKSSGWMLKVSDSKKALYYFISLENSFSISLTIRENERETFLKDQSLSAYHEPIKKAGKFSEGYNLIFDVADEKSYEYCERIITCIMSFR